MCLSQTKYFVNTFWAIHRYTQLYIVHTDEDEGRVAFRLTVSSNIEETLSAVASSTCSNWYESKFVSSNIKVNHLNCSPSTQTFSFYINNSREYASLSRVFACVSVSVCVCVLPRLKSFKNFHGAFYQEEPKRQHTTWPLFFDFENEKCRTT